MYFSKVPRNFLYSGNYLFISTQCIIKSNFDIGFLFVWEAGLKLTIQPQADLELTAILLPMPPECWDYRCTTTLNWFKYVNKTYASMWFFSTRHIIFRLWRSIYSFSYTQRALFPIFYMSKHWKSTALKTMQTRTCLAVWYIWFLSASILSTYL